VRCGGSRVQSEVHRKRGRLEQSDRVSSRGITRRTKTQGVRTGGELTGQDGLGGRDSCACPGGHLYGACRTVPAAPSNCPANGSNGSKERQFGARLTAVPTPLGHVAGHIEQVIGVGREASGRGGLRGDRRGIGRVGPTRRIEIVVLKILTPVVCLLVGDGIAPWESLAG
jgi:hypothetical protein